MIVFAIMKRAGEVLSALFDERLMKKAQGYSRLFSYWDAAVHKNGIAAAADHSRICELDRGILRVEADHPGWIQILQTKENYILNDFRRTFPDMDISGISLMLSRGGAVETEAAKESETAAEPADAAAEEATVTSNDEPAISGYDNIKDSSFKAALMSLGKSIAQREASVKNRS